MQRTVRLKRGRGRWFAAGAGCERALRELSDATFKVFMHVCLRAERASGCLEFEREQLARTLGKGRSSLGRCLRELVAKGVCEVQAAPNQYRVSRLRVVAEYWPYEVREESGPLQPARTEAVAAESDPGAYVAAVKRWFCQPACVAGRFGPEDERLAAEWHSAGVALETVRRAILLGSVRKSMSLLDRPGGEPVQSLRYFTSLVEEVRAESFPAAYWRHVEFNLRRCERHWQDQRLDQGGSACPDLEQANPSPPD